MVNELPAATIFEFVRNDFRKAWDAMAAVDFMPGVGGNFMFARQAMALLELTCRVAAADGSGETLDEFSNALEQRDPLLFTCLPGGPPSGPGEFVLPSSQTAGGPSQCQLLSVLFDLIRNGQAHQYQQIAVSLTDGAVLDIAIGGVEPGQTLAKTIDAEGHRSADHLLFHMDMRPAPVYFWVWVLPQLLFLDFEAAAQSARVFERGLTPEWMERPRKGRGYAFSGADLEVALLASPYMTMVSEPPTP